MVRVRNGDCSIIAVLLLLDSSRRRVVSGFLE